jgi:hypothetical protein
MEIAIATPGKKMDTICRSKTIQEALTTQIHGCQPLFRFFFVFFFFLQSWHLLLFRKRNFTPLFSFRPSLPCGCTWF